MSKQDNGLSYSHRKNWNCLFSQATCSFILTLLWVYRDCLVKNAVLKAWDEIPYEYIRKLVSSIKEFGIRACLLKWRNNSLINMLFVCTFWTFSVVPLLF